MSLILTPRCCFIRLLFGGAVLSFASVSTACTTIDNIVFTMADPGDLTGTLVDKMQSAADELVERSTYNGSLIASKVSRDLQILLGDARAYLHDEVGETLNGLGRQELEFLGKIDGAIASANSIAEAGALIEEKGYLDLDQVIDKLCDFRSSEI